MILNNQCWYQPGNRVHLLHSCRNAPLRVAITSTRCVTTQEAPGNTQCSSSMLLYTCYFYNISPRNPLVKEINRYMIPLIPQFLRLSKCDVKYTLLLLSCLCFCGQMKDLKTSQEKTNSLDRESKVCSPDERRRPH